MKYFLFSLVMILALALPMQVFAVDVPTFPSCSNPQGTVTSSFDNGTHGIVGNPGEFSGSDKVYKIDDEKTLQCFCAADGSGIQTNWWKISSLNQEEIEQLKKLDWTYVPTGSVWGLSNDPYMALNTNYSCKSSTGGSTQGSSTSNNSSTPQVLGLASTGNSIVLWALALLSASSLLMGVIAKRKLK